MQFKLASEVEQVCCEMKLADFPRGLDRARINDLMNGVPPYTQQEAEENNIAVNVNFLEGTRLHHDARSQFYGSFLKPGRYFNATTDMGAKHRRAERSAIVTKEISRIMKRSLEYYEVFRSNIALDVLHGIGPSGWDKCDFWCPDPYGVEDVLIPANTLLTMKNLPFFAKYRSYTGPELIKIVRNGDTARKAGWNMDLVEQCIDYIDRETLALQGTNWPEVWSPEKAAERVKGDGGFYAGDQVPTIDVFDFYFWNDEGKTSGWCRRMILDSWSTPSALDAKMNWNDKVDFARNQFLFNSKNRKYASDWKQIISFQFADLSAVAPFHYNSVRSLGYLLYAVCSLQNRLRCKLSEATFSDLMMWFRVKSADDAQRALNIDMAGRVFLDDTVQLVPANERWTINENLVQNTMSMNSQLISEGSASFTQSRNMSQDRVEKTKFQVMAEVNAATAMLSAGFQQAYAYQTHQYREIFRRFMLPISRDPDIVRFRSACLRQGVPESILTPDAWDIEPERVLGAGNRTLEMAIAEQMMNFRNLYDPDAQRTILRDVTLAITEDPARAENLVPQKKMTVNDATHDAQMASAAILMGLPMGQPEGVNHIDYVNAMIMNLHIAITKVMQRGGMADGEKIEGLQNMLQHIEGHIKIVAQDKNEKRRIMDWHKLLVREANQIKAFAQRLQQQQKAQAAQGPAPDPKLQAKIAEVHATADADRKIQEKVHAQRTAQKQLAFEMEQKRKDDELKRELEREDRRHARELLEEQNKAALELGHEKNLSAVEIAEARLKRRMKSTQE